jgi:hypothetical protein
MTQDAHSRKRFNDLTNARDARRRSVDLEKAAPTTVIAKATDSGRTRRCERSLHALCYRVSARNSPLTERLRVPRFDEPWLK